MLLLYLGCDLRQQAGGTGRRRQGREESQHKGTWWSFLSFNSTEALIFWRLSWQSQSINCDWGKAKGEELSTSSLLILVECLPHHYGHWHFRLHMCEYHRGSCPTSQHQQGSCGAGDRRDIAFGEEEALVGCSYIKIFWAHNSAVPMEGLKQAWWGLMQVSDTTMDLYPTVSL